MENNHQSRMIQPYRFIPFDIGCSIDEKKKQSIYAYLYAGGYAPQPIPSFLNNLSSDILFYTQIDHSIKLFIYSFGIGVFVIKDDVYIAEREKYAVEYCASRKKAHSALLSKSHNKSDLLTMLMEKIREIATDDSEMRISASPNWENHGLSYVMTASFIQNPDQSEFDYHNFSELEKKNMLIMLEPSIAHQEDSLIISLTPSTQKDPYDFSISDMAEITDWVKSKDCSIFISWAAVVVCTQKVNEKYLDFIECLEVDLQAMWMYIYCLRCNLMRRTQNQKHKISTLKNELFYIRRKFNSFNSKNDSSVPAYVTSIRSELIASSGINEEYLNYIEHLNFYIEEAENLDNESQKKYTILSEILLFIIAYVQIAPMAYEFMRGGYSDIEILPALFIIIVGVVCCFAIARKE